MRSVAVIPAYNEARTIGEVVRRTRGFVDCVIVIDDGSKDGTAEAASEKGAEVLKLEENSGKANATKIGFSRCNGYDVVITLDGDLQHLPEEIPKLVECVEGGADLCIGSRFLGGKVEMPLSNRLSNSVARVIINLLTGLRITDPQSGFRALRSGKLGELKIEAERYAIEHIMIIESARKGFNVSEVPISCIYGDENSHIRPLRDSMRVTYDILRHVFRRS